LKAILMTAAGPPEVLQLADVPVPAYGEAQLTVARQRNLTLTYVLMLTPMMFGMHEAWRNQRIMLEQAARLIDAGKLNVNVSHTFALDQAAEAHRLIEAGHTSGKIVLTIE
jgi:NADPH:quinone reductase